jgi:UDP-N-acetylglucosamine 4,6-dehydratase
VHRRRPDLSGRSVLVTGGTGSFGQVVLGRLLRAGCREVRVLSRDEAKQYAMRFSVGDPRLALLLGDVRDRDSVQAAMRGVDLVFHAAALKQVPNCESFPEQAVQTNVLGSLNVLRAAVAANVDRVVCLSTDKAVYPINAMGMTKALMEKLVQAEARRPGGNGRTTLCVVRYGNVLCSRGSVVPLFIDQIAAGRPLGVTVPGMTRFLLRLEDAVDLVETALVYGKQGDIFVRKSPACTVGMLAQSLVRLLDTAAKVAILGARPGEKMHETLATVEEMRSAHDCGDAWRIPADRSDLIDPDPARRMPHQGRDYNSEHAERLDLAAVMALLAGLPEVKAAIVAQERSPSRGTARHHTRAQPELHAL